MNIQDIRANFPHTAHTIYLNHAATAPLSLRVSAAYQKWIQERQNTPIDNYFQFQQIVDGTRQGLADLIRTTPDRVDVAPNVSVALNYLAQGFPWKRGDRIAIPACEFPANVWPFLHLQRLGVEIDFIPHEQGVFRLEDVERALTPQTRLLTISWVQFLSGFRAPLAEIGKLTRERGIWFCVDVIQGSGALDLGDAEAQGIDFIAGGGQKWMMADQGIGWFYISKQLQEVVTPPMAGWLSGVVDWDNFFDYRFNWHEDAMRFRQGTLNNPGIAALHAALGQYAEAGVSFAHEQTLANAAYLAQGLAELGFTRYGTDDPGAASGIVTVSHPDVQGVFDALNQQQIIISVRNKLLRFSPTYYNDRVELDRTLAVLADWRI